MPGGDTNTGSTTSFTSQPGFNQIAGTAMKLFNNGAAFAPDTTSHVSPFSTQTSGALKGIQSTATSALPALNRNFDRVNATVSQGGLNPLQEQQVARLQQAGAGNGLNAMQQKAYNDYTPTANGLNSQQQTAYDQIAKIAAGGERSGNPYVEDILKRNADDITLAGQLDASGTGRYGSGAHQGITQDAIGDNASALRYKNYTDETGRMDAAQGQAFGAGTTGANQRSAAIGNQAALGTLGNTQRNDAIASLFNAGATERANTLAGTQQLTDAYNAKLSPYQTQLGVGKAYEDKNAQVLADNARVQAERKGALTAPVNWLSSLLSGYQGGQQTTQNQQPSNTFGNVLGGGLAGFDLFGGPLGALAGGLGGLFGK